MERTTGSSCVACGLTDRRAIVDVNLDDGTSVSLCGSHAVMLRRIGARSCSTTDLARLLRDRRHERDRRSEDVDTLAMALRVGFSGDRRKRSDRRVG